MTKTILLDCDDVLLDWIGGFRDWASDKLGRKVEGLPDSWNMGKWMGTTDEFVGELIREHNTGDHFGQLKAVPGARSVVNDWHADPTVRMHVITSCSTDPGTVAMRRENLEREFGAVFDSIHCLDLGQSKLDILQAFSPGALWVEDNYKNALLGFESGHRVIMRERPHNAEYRQLGPEDGVVWFKEWADFYDFDLMGEFHHG